MWEYGVSYWGDGDKEGEELEEMLNRQDAAGWELVALNRDAPPRGSRGEDPLIRVWYECVFRRRRQTPA